MSQKFSSPVLGRLAAANLVRAMRRRLVGVATAVETGQVRTYVALIFRRPRPVCVSTLLADGLAWLT